METEKAVLDMAKEMARNLRDGCDGAYVGAEIESTEKINGKDIKIWVCAFWESSSHFDYTAKGEDFKDSRSLLSM
jgi:hypothetical protein